MNKKIPMIVVTTAKLRGRKRSTRTEQLRAYATSAEKRQELAAAVTALAAAAKRTRKIGAADAVEDKQVASLVRRATTLLSAAAQEPPKRKSHKLRNLALVSLSAGAAYAAYRSRIGTSGLAAT